MSSSRTMNGSWYLVSFSLEVVMFSCDDVKCTCCGCTVDSTETIVTWDGRIGCSHKVCLKCFDKQLDTMIFQTFFESLDDVMKFSKKDQKVLDKLVEIEYNKSIKNGICN